MMGIIYSAIFWLVVIMSFTSGFCMFFLKLPSMYRPDVYLVGRPGSDLAPGDGSTPFEVLATFVFALVYLVPLPGMVMAHFSGSALAKRAANMALFLYHAASVYGMRYVFRDALNHTVMSALNKQTFGRDNIDMHAVFALLCLFLVLFARGEDDGHEKKKR